MRRKLWNTLIATTISLLLLGGLYVGSYALMLGPGVEVLPESNEIAPNYRSKAVWVAEFYGPIHELDKQLCVERWYRLHWTQPW